MSIQVYLLNSRSLILLFKVLLIAGINFGCTSIEKQDQLNGVNFNSVSDAKHTMHYAYSGDISKQGILFVHGTPGGWSAFVDYLNNPELQQHFFMVSVDRLNWGKSSSQQELSFDQQIDAMSLVLENHENKKWIIVGHSLGASIAPKFALNHPNSIAALVLLAGSLSPKLGKPRWYNRFANTSLLNWLVPSKLQRANIEIMALEEELTIMNEQILSSQIDNPVVVIQGMKDKLVSPKNAQFITNNWQNNIKNLEVIQLTEEGHFLPWRQTELIIQSLKKLDHCLNTSDSKEC